MVSRLLDAIPEVERAGVHDCDVLFLSFIAPGNDFVPDKLLLDAVSRRPGLPVVIFDHTETFSDNFILGADNLEPGSPYDIIDAMLHKELNTKLYFKRELMSCRGMPIANFPVFPLDWTLQAITPPKVDTEAEYHARPIDIFYCFGYSNESRPRLMGELLKQAGRFNAHWCLTEEDLDRALQEKRERIFALLHVPHYRRIHFSKIFDWQHKSKVSISMFGAAPKCFRNAEASYNCVMAQQEPGLVEWSYPWVHGENCIGLSNIPDEEEQEIGHVETLHSALRVHQGSLYPIYLKGMENNRNYWNQVYARDYLLPKIKEALK